MRYRSLDDYSFVGVVIDQLIDMSNTSDTSAGGAGDESANRDETQQQQGVVGGASNNNNNNNNEMELSTPTTATSFTYTPRTTNKNDIIALQSELSNMQAHYKKHGKELGDMDDDFINSFQSIKRNITDAKRNIELHLAGLKEYGLDDASITTMKQIYGSNEPKHQEGQERFLNYALANMNQKIEAEKKFHSVTGEKRKLDEENVVLKKELDEFKKPKYETKSNTNNNGRDHHHHYGSSQNSFSSSTNGYGLDGNNSTISSTTVKTIAFANPSFEKKFSQKDDIRIHEDVQTVYQGHAAKNIFDMVLTQRNATLKK